MQKKQPPKTGFTLVEVLAIVTILIILGGASISIAVLGAQKKARDTERIAVLKEFKKALALYYQDNGHYPPALKNGAADLGEYKYWKDPPTCSIDHFTGSTAPDIRFNNSYKIPFLDDLYPKYTNKDTWSDPLGGNCGDSPTACGVDTINLSLEWNCRYIIPVTSNYDYFDPATHNEIQAYYLHCRLETEAQRENVGKNDGGWNDKLYEIFEPNPWLCVTDTYS